jgi:hypothetical protein
MSTETLFAVVAFLLVSVVLGITGTAIHWKMVAAVNAKLDEKERFDLLGWYPWTWRRFIKQYWRLYPDGRLIRQTVVVGAISLVIGVWAMWAIGFGLGAVLFLGCSGAVGLWLQYRP